MASQQGWSEAQKCKKDISSVSAVPTSSEEIPTQKGLNKRKTRADVARWYRNQHSQFVKKVLRAIERRSLSDERKSTIRALASDPAATSVFVMSNHKLLSEAYTRLGQHLADLAAENPQFEFGLATFISGDGGTSLYRPVIELPDSQAKVQRTLREIAPNWFGITELAMFNSHAHPDGGAYVQRHEHAILVGEDLEKNAANIIAKHSKKFSANITEARVIDFKLLESRETVNLERMAAYLMKAPAKAMNWCPPRHGKPGHMNKSEKGDRFIRYLRMLQLRSMLKFEECVFAGGRGLKFKSDLTKRPMATADAPPNRRSIHPDAIPAFWVEVAKELKQDRWELPVIIKKK